MTELRIPTWMDVRRIRDLYVDMTCASVAEVLRKRGFALPNDKCAIEIVECIYLRRDWPIKVDAENPPRPTWRHINAIRLAHPAFSCGLIGALLFDRGFGPDRNKLCAWVRATYQRRGWANPGSTDPALRNAASVQALDLSVELRIAHDRARRLAERDAMNVMAKKVVRVMSDKFTRRAERREHMWVD